MTRYLAFAWTDPDGADLAVRWRDGLRSEGWARAFAREGLEVWTVSGRRTPVRELAPGGAVVIGDLLDRRGPPGTPARFPEARATALDAARRLLETAWGSYVAILPDPAGAAFVLRDPSGALGALTWRLAGVSAVADDVRGLPGGLAPADLALDWEAITEILRQPYSSHHLSPLAGYAVVTPGDLHPLGSATGAVGLWRPARWVSDPDDVAAERLVTTVRDAVGGLAAVEDRLVLEISGGLDSAVVAAGLDEAGQGRRVVTAAHHFASRREGDERCWARAVADGRGFPLELLPQRIEPLVEADFAELATCAGPAFAALDPAQDRDLARLAAATGASAIFGGQGGDAVFFQMPSAAPVADLLRARGLAAVADPFVGRLARWLRRSAWSVLQEALTPARPAPAPMTWRQFWGPRALAGGGPPPHPWLADLAGAPRGKQVQIASIVGTLESWGRSRRGAAANVVQPLLSQPVLEVCLGIPTWRLVDAGRDRAFARRAFAAWLPPAVATRRAKGALGTLYAKRTAESLPFLRAHLLDGVLVGAGVLDRAALAAALTTDDLRWRADGARLSWAAMLESWVRDWQTRAPDLRTPRGGRW